MVAKAIGRYLPVSPRKVRAVVRILRGRGVVEAQGILGTLPKGACAVVSKVLDSALANATRAGVWTKEQLVISRILADGGPALKRFRAAPMGRAVPIRKQLTHLTIELDAKR